MRGMMSSLLAIGTGIGAAYMMSNGNNMNMNRTMRRMRRRMRRAFR
ncbi:DUF3918 family protein [Bacillus tianshenii]|nr:DUF3918 family protein [Bacillus tianshenii]